MLSAKVLPPQSQHIRNHVDINVIQHIHKSWKLHYCGIAVAFAPSQGNVCVFDHKGKRSYGLAMAGNTHSNLLAYLVGYQIHMGPAFDCTY